MSEMEDIEAERMGEELAARDEATKSKTSAIRYDTVDYMTTETDKNVLKNLSKMGEHLKELKLKMIKAEAEYSDAKKEYEYYASTVLPMEMFNAGVSEVKLINGGVMTYERKFYCQPNKNAADKQTMAEWLKAHGYAYIVKPKAEVDGSKLDDLRTAGIPYIEIDDINTNSLKAALKDLIGANGGIPKVTIDQIPACMHFQEVGIVDIAV